MLTRRRFAAHVLRRRGPWISGGALAVMLALYVSGFFLLRRTTNYLFAVSDQRGTTTVTYQFHSFRGGPTLAPIFYTAYIPMHRYCLGGMTLEEFAAMSSPASALRGGARDVYPRNGDPYRWSVR